MPDSFACRGGKAVGQGAHIVFIHCVRLRIPALPLK